MAQTTVEARQQLLDTLAEATEEIGLALASLGAAYEQLDVYHADELEEQLFRPVQLAYGRARRTHAEFAGRHGLAGRAFEPPAPGLASIGAKGFINNAVVAVGKADTALAGLQDSLLPVEVGDPDLRARLAELRGLVGNLAQRAREVVRTIGR
jgi:transcriptional accessory protein Tex/SPT6